MNGNILYKSIYTPFLLRVFLICLALFYPTKGNLFFHFLFPSIFGPSSLFCRIKKKEAIVLKTIASFLKNFGKLDLRDTQIKALELESVSYAPYRLDILRFGGIHFDFLTNFLDVDRYRCNVSD